MNWLFKAFSGNPFDSEQEKLFMEKNNDFRPELNSGKREIFSDEQTDQKVQKHIEDEDDEITDQDLENIKTEMTPATLAEEKEAARKEGYSEEEISEIDEDDQA